MHANSGIIEDSFFTGKLWLNDEPEETVKKVEQLSKEAWRKEYVSGFEDNNSFTNQKNIKIKNESKENEKYGKS